MENTDANTIDLADALSTNYTLVFMPVILTLLENYHTVRASWTDVTVIGEGEAFPLKSIMDSITDKLDALGISWNSSYIDDENMSYRHGLIKCKKYWFGVYPPTGHEKDVAINETKVTFYNVAPRD